MDELDAKVTELLERDKELHRKYVEIYENYSSQFDKLKILILEKHKKVCTYIETNTDYYIQTQQKVIREANCHFTPYFKIFFSTNKEDWNFVDDIIVDDVEKMCNMFRLKIMTLNYTACDTPITCDLEELIKIKWTGEFNEKLIYSNEWFADQLRKTKGAYNE